MELPISSEHHKKISPASVQNYNGLIMNRIQITLSYMDRGFSGFEQVLGLRAILKPEYANVIEPQLSELDKKYINTIRIFEIKSSQKGTAFTYKQDMWFKAVSLKKEYVRKALPIIMGVLDKYGILEYEEREIINSGVMY